MSSAAGHSERGHALLGASKASQWLNCPPSARLQESIPDRRSEYANEGEFMHEMAECILRQRIAARDDTEQLGLVIALKGMHGSPYFNAEIERAVNDYVAVVEERFMEAKKRSEDAVVLLEEQLDFSDWVPEGYGTGDVVIIADGVMEIVDLKGGKGVPVDAVGNPQLRLYALGAWSSWNYLYDIQEIRMTIVQPRLDSVSTDSMSVTELLEWAETVVRPNAELAFAGKGEFKAGSHCRWCKVKATCKARSDENMKLLAHEFREPALLTDEEIGSILAVAEELARWAKDVQEYAFEQAKSGHRIPQWKLVAGHSNRVITDKEKAQEILTNAGFEAEKILKPNELLGIGDLEKVVGKKELAAFLGDLIVKPQGKPVLVPETDRRPELNSLDDDFAAEDFDV